MGGLQPSTGDAEVCRDRDKKRATCRHPAQQDCWWHARQPTLFEGSSFNASFKMGMASLYSPC